MSTPAERMYPLTPPAPEPAKALEANVELQPNKGMALQAGVSLTEKPAAADPASDAPPSSDAGDPAAQAPPIVELTQELIDATLPEAVREQRKAEGAERTYVNTFAGLMGKATLGPQQALVHTELAHMAMDLGMQRDDVATFIPLARRFSLNAPDAAILENWKTLTTAEEKSLAAQEMQRDPRIPGVLKILNLTESPQAIRYLARSAQRRR